MFYATGPSLTAVEEDKCFELWLSLPWHLANGRRRLRVLQREKCILEALQTKHLQFFFSLASRINVLKLKFSKKYMYVYNIAEYKYVFLLPYIL